MDQDVSDMFAAHDARITKVENGAVETKTAITDLAEKVTGLTLTQKTQLDILLRLDRVASNPHVKVIVMVLATVLGAWAANRGLGGGLLGGGK